MVFCPEHPNRDQNLKFTPLSETTSIHAPFIWKSPRVFMKLNAKTCKEPRVCFLKRPPGTPHPLYELIDKYSKTVHSHKVLGLVIQENLKNSVSSSV